VTAVLDFQLEANLEPLRKTPSSERNMDQTYTAVVKQDGGWWIGWIEEVPGVNCQERSRDELLESLRVTLSEALEMNRTEARNAAGKGYEELKIAV
jgi:predicted RNase H-like HicB family nuclease